MQQFGKMTSKGQTTIPKEIREQLKLKAGDTLAYEVQGSAVSIHKVTPFDSAWHQAVTGTLEEWASPEDDEAFKDL